MVRLPVTLYLSLAVDAIFVLLNVISGNFSTSKKLAPRRSLSRSAFWVSMLADLIANSTVEASGFAGSTLMVVLKSLKRPETLLTRCRIEKVASECALSETQVSAARTGEARAATARATARNVVSLRVISSSSPWFVDGGGPPGRSSGGTGNGGDERDPWPPARHGRR